MHRTQPGVCHQATVPAGGQGAACSPDTTSHDCVSPPGAGSCPPRLWCPARPLAQLLGALGPGSDSSTDQLMTLGATSAWSDAQVLAGSVFRPSQDWQGVHTGHWGDGPLTISSFPSSSCLLSPSSPSPFLLLSGEVCSVQAGEGGGIKAPFPPVQDCAPPVKPLSERRLCVTYWKAGQAESPSHTNVLQTQRALRPWGCWTLWSGHWSCPGNGATISHHPCPQNPASS